MKRVGLYYDDIFLEHKTPLWHPESSSRLKHLMASLKQSDIWIYLKKMKPTKASFEHIALVHREDYIRGIQSLQAGYIDGDTYFSEKTLEASLYAAGAVIDGINKIKDDDLDRAFCAVRPPGHHAEAHKAMGFCIFNNIAVGARYAQTVGYEKIFIIDFDVHHGNGTQHIFEADHSVFYFSTHQFPHYPGTGSQDECGVGKGKGYTYNVPIKPGTGDNEFSKIYQEIAPKLISDFNPDMVLVSAGYDIHKHDPLSATMVSNEGVKNIVKAIVSSCNKPFVFALEGGYNIPALEDSVRVTLEEMLKS